MRLFFAIQIPEGLRGLLSNLTGEFKAAGRFRLVEAGNIHITLKFIGEADENKKDELIEKIKEIKQPKFRVSLNGVGVFPNENFIKVVWVGTDQGSPEIISLNQQINEALDLKDLNFHPHATIARVKFLKDKTGFKEFLENNKETYFGEFKVSSFYLMQSELSPQGPKYSVLEKLDLS